VVIRIGSERAAALAKGNLRIFEPMPGRLWKEYLQVDAGALPKAKLAALAGEALDWTDKLPPKPASSKLAAKKAVAKAAAARPAVKAAAPAAKKTAAKPAAKAPAARKSAAKKPAASGATMRR